MSAPYPKAIYNLYLNASLWQLLPIIAVAFVGNFGNNFMKKKRLLLGFCFDYCLGSILIYEMERKGHTNADIDSFYGRQYQFELERYNHACDCNIDVNGIMISSTVLFICSFQRDGKQHYRLEIWTHTR